MENNKKTPLIIDRPRERNRLVLGFTNYIDAICNFIMDSVPHFTVGIFGEWGAGKTTLLKNIQTDLEKHYGCACVMFDAWEYEDETTQMAIPLILTIITAIYKNNKGEIEKLEDEQNDENQDITEDIRRVVSGLEEIFSFCESSFQTQTYHSSTEEQIKVIYEEHENNKKEYRRLLAILQKGEGRTYKDIANEHGVRSGSVQRWDL